MGVISPQVQILSSPLRAPYFSGLLFFLDAFSIRITNQSVPKNAPKSLKKPRHGDRINYHPSGGVSGVSSLVSSSFIFPSDQNQTREQLLFSLPSIIFRRPFSPRTPYAFESEPIPNRFFPLSERFSPNPARNNERLNTRPLSQQTPPCRRQPVTFRYPAAIHQFPAV